MFQHRICVRRPYSQRDLILRRFPIVTVLFSSALLIACGGHPAALNNTNQPGNSPSALNISPSLPSGSVGSQYNANVTVSGGSAPYAFSVISGQLPAGVSLASNTGAITGTPTASGNFGFSLAVSDSKGVSAQQGLQISVSNSSSPGSGGTNSGNSGGSSQGNSFSNLQRAGGWSGFGQQPPNYVDCSPSPCNGMSFWMGQNINSPSLSGAAAEFNISGSVPFSDGLWTNHLIGPGSSQGLPDTNNSMVSTVHNFTYDVYIWGDKFELSQALEFDVNQFFDGMGFIFGHECRLASGYEWDVWDNQNAKWVPTGVPCRPNDNSWNHLTVQVQRDGNNNLVYQSITFNGVTSNLNWVFPHGSAPNWYGVTVNFQMDGDVREDSYNIYLDNLTVSYQ